MMQAIPTLSILISCFNYAEFLPACLDSILQQDYQDYELILIDDGSSDRSWELIQTYGAKYEQIRIFKNSANLGLFKSYQEGWGRARGKYLHFFSADDLYHPTYLSKVMRVFLDRPDLHLVCTDMAYFEDSSGSAVKGPTNHSAAPYQHIQPSEVISLLQKSTLWIPGLTCIVKAETLQKHGHLDPYLENLSDWFCFHKIAMMEGMSYIPEKLISMRLHDKTYTATVKKDKMRRRQVYYYLLQLLVHHPQLAHKFKEAGLLNFIFKELGWKLRLNPRYFSLFRRPFF